METRQGHRLTSDEWNDSLAGDFMWTNSNFCEAIGDVMTPATWSMWEMYMEAVPFHVPGYPLVGVIGGRPYINLSVLASLGQALGMDASKMLQRAQDLWGRVPEGVNVPLLPLTRWQLLRTMSSLVILGACIAIGSWLALALLLVARLLEHLGIVAEEEVCLKLYGEAYRAYLEQTPRHFLFF